MSKTTPVGHCLFYDIQCLSPLYQKFINTVTDTVAVYYKQTFAQTNQIPTVEDLDKVARRTIDVLLTNSLEFRNLPLVTFSATALKTSGEPRHNIYIQFSKRLLNQTNRIIVYYDKSYVLSLPMKTRTSST